MKTLCCTLVLNLFFLSVAAQPLNAQPLNAQPLNGGEQPNLYSTNALPNAQASLTRSSSEQFNISRMTVDNGGKHATSNQFALSGTVGQPDASVTRASAGYRLSGGFWISGSGDIVIPTEPLFADGFESQ